MENTDHIINFFPAIKNIVSIHGRENPSDFKGLSQKEINLLESKYKTLFPLAYRCFLENFAAGNLRVFDGQKYHIDGIEAAHEVAAEIMETENNKLPDNSFPFSQWQGYQFFYFINSGASNPDTYFYVEGGNDLLVSPPTNKHCHRFTDWLVTQVVGSLRLSARLYKWDTSRGIELAKGLYTEGAEW